MADLTPEALDALQEHIAQKAWLIQMCEKIKWGSDTDALNDANAAITALRAQLATARTDALREAADVIERHRDYGMVGPDGDFLGDEAEVIAHGNAMHYAMQDILALIDTPSYDADVTPEVVAQIRTERGVDVSDPKWVTIDTPSAPSPEAVARAALEWAAELFDQDADGMREAENLYYWMAEEDAKRIRTAASDPATLAAIVAKAGGGE